MASAQLGIQPHLTPSHLPSPTTSPLLALLLTASPSSPLELLLSSLSQPFSLEEQEQLLSCLSIDSLSLSDDNEVRQPHPDQGDSWGPCGRGAIFTAETHPEHTLGNGGQGHRALLVLRQSPQCRLPAQDRALSCPQGTQGALSM